MGGTSREAADRLADDKPVGRTVWLPTPAEVQAVRAFALTQPTMGYKRLAWLMVDKDVAYLNPYRVREILSAAGLLRMRIPPSMEPLSRPPAAERPDEQWHTDIMYLRVAGRWYYLVDIIDAYSRYLVHWSLNLTMHAQTVSLTVQEALDRLTDRRSGEPKIVHDHGSQFTGTEWRTLIAGAAVTDIPTRVAHPQSNGVVERLHRPRQRIGDRTVEAANAGAQVDHAKGRSVGWSHKRRIDQSGFAELAPMGGWVSILGQHSMLAGGFDSTGVQEPSSTGHHEQR